MRIYLELPDMELVQVMVTENTTLGELKEKVEQDDRLLPRETQVFHVQGRIGFDDETVGSLGLQPEEVIQIHELGKYKPALPSILLDEYLKLSPHVTFSLFTKPGKRPDSFEKVTRIRTLGKIYLGNKEENKNTEPFYLATENQRNWISKLRCSIL